MKEISSLRRRIDEIDDQILRLLKERVDVCKNIGAVKRKHGVPVRDWQREDELYARIAQKASEFGLNPLDVKAIYREIFALCIHVQEDR